MPEILIVEDEAELRENICAILELKGYVVHYAENGLDAIKKLNKINPDLIISDIMMPYVDGYELFNRIRQEERTKYIPFLFLTAKSDLASVRQGMNIGADDYITKPFSTDDLVKSIEARLEKVKNFNQKFDKILSGIRSSLPHELRTPLMGILGLSEMITTDYQEYSKEEIFDFVERINFSAKRLLKRIEKFLQLTDLELIANSDMLNKIYEARVNEEEIKLIAFNNFIVNNRFKDISFNIEEAYLKIHPKFFSILISELLENACKFSSNNTEIKLTGKKMGDYYELSFNDSGIGMSETNVKNINEFLVMDRENGKIYGNGLGLVFVKKALKLFNGQLKLESEKDKGTMVTITIPLVAVG